MRRLKIWRFNKQKYLESGLTLIECLVAIVVIALTTATIAPMMVFSVATRVQNQKTEQALQLAQAEIDRVRLIVEQGGDYGDDLLLVTLANTYTSAANAPAPDAFVETAADADLISEARKIDIDSDGDTDFAIQTFRTEGISVAATTAGSTPVPVIFQMGVRVYDARAENNLGSLQREEAGLAFTSGEGDRGAQPLAVLYSEISQGDRVGSLCQIWDNISSDPIPASLSCS